jgi:hypothetical protein
MRNSRYLTPTDALTEALVLSITAPDEERSARAATLADELVCAFNISPADVQRAKTRAFAHCAHDPSLN